MVREGTSQAEKSPDELPDSDGVTSCAWTDLVTWQTCDAGTQASEREFSYPEATDDSPDPDRTEVKALEQPVPDNTENRAEAEPGMQTTESKQGDAYVVDCPDQAPRPQRKKRIPARFRDHWPTVRSCRFRW